MHMFCFVKSVIGVRDFGRARWGQCQLLPELVEGSIPSATSGDRTLCGGMSWWWTDFKAGENCSITSCSCFWVVPGFFLTARFVLAILLLNGRD